MSKTKATALTILGIILFIVVVLALDYGSVLWQSVIAPKREDVRREVWMNTQSHIQGKCQDLANYKQQWDEAEPGSAARSAVETTIRHSFSDFDETNIESPGLRQFLIRIRGY